MYHTMKPYGADGSTVHTFILALDRQTGRLLAAATAPNVPHEHEAGRTSDTAWMFWRPKKFVPLPEFEPQFLGHAAHSPNGTMPNPSILCVTQHSK